MPGTVKSVEMFSKSKVCEHKISPSLKHQANLTNYEQFKNSYFEHSNSNHKNVVFVNPKKLNSNQLPKINTHLETPTKETMRNNLVKVYINPNFNKFPLPGNNLEQKSSSCSSIYPTQGETTSNSIFRKYPFGTESILTKEPGVKSQNYQNYDVPKDNKICSVMNKNCKIFINPNYTRPSHVDSEINRVSTANQKVINISYKTDNVQDKNSELGPGSTKVISDAPSTITVLKTGSRKYSVKKRNMFLNKTNTLKELPLEGKVAKSTNTIFVNPKFQSRLQNMKENGSIIDNQDKLHPSLVSKTIPILTTERPCKNDFAEQKSSCQTSSSIPQLSPLNRCLKTVQPIKQVCVAKIDSQRKRSCSTSLVAVSATKLIRKKKPSQRLETNIKSNLNEPVFLSKTKLVRSIPNKCLKNKLLEKAKVKRVIQRAQLQMLTPDKMNRFRKQSFKDSVANLVNVTNCASVTKIKSRNGKSLRLVRKQDELKKPIAKLINKKNINTTQSQKLMLKQQLRKNALCVVKKLRMRFSKINVEQSKKTNSSISNKSKYVYKSKEFTLKQIQRKSVNKKLSLNKPKGTNYLSEKCKYRYIRKQNFKSSNKYERPRKELKNTIHNSKILNKSTRKWKLQNPSSKQNNIRKKLSLVNIGGIFYCCSRTSLSRNKSPSKVSQVAHKQSKGLLLNISGKKFHLENNGQTLKCLSSTPGRKRIDIGGVTFVTTSSGSSLIRTNYHNARSIITQAKQKSLSQLTKRHKKNNEPCPFYHRLGRCFGKERGFCVRLHDPKYIAVCKKFIQGICEDSKCLLSHKFNCHNMPTCQHFLAGHCGRDDCPYPHIKVNDSAPICIDFLRGFCAHGDQCAKRHLEICPSFEKGMCPRGKYCPYPHPKSKSHVQLKGKFKHLERKPQPPRDLELVSSSSLRYFEDVNLQNEKNIEHSEDLKEPEMFISEKEENVSQFRKRPRLGRLPSFIPLTFDKSFSDSISEEPEL